MSIENVIDKFISNLIIFISYIIVISLWYYFFNLQYRDISSVFFLPYGIIVLGFLFFSNKIIFGLALAQVSFYLILQNYNLELPFNNYFSLSLSQLMCMPIALLVFQKFNITVGTSENYILDKTNIYHVLLITFFSTIILGTLLTFSSLFFYNETNILIFALGNFFGALILIVLMKTLVNTPKVIKSLIKNN